MLCRDLNRIPIRKVVNGIPILVRDVAYVRDGSPPQLNSVRANGSRMRCSRRS